jgi:hypothetical protein
MISLSFILCFFTVHVFSQDSNSAIYEGKFVFNFNIDTAFVQFGIANPSLKKIASGDTLVVSNGFYHIFISYPTNEDHYLTRNVLKDSTYTISHNFDLSRENIELKSSNASLKYLLGGDTIILTDDDTRIFIDNEYVSTEYYSFFMKDNKNLVSFKNTEFVEREKTLTKRPNREIQIEDFHFYPNKERFPIYAILPGMTYLKERNYTKLALVMAGFTISTTYFIKYQSEYSSMIPEYNVIRDLYLQETDEVKALNYANQMEDHRKQFNTINVKRNAALYGLLSFVAIDIINKVKLFNTIETRNNKRIKN